MLASTTPDTFLLQSHASTYDQPFFFESAQPALASIAPDGKSAIDLRTNTPGDQTIPIGSLTRVRIDPIASYQITFITQAGEGNLSVESFDELGVSLGATRVPYDYVTPEDARYRLVTVRGVIGPSGHMLPANTTFIELNTQFLATQFGFLEDQVFSFVSNGLVDRHQAPIPLRVDLARPLTISYQVIRNVSNVTPQTHTLGFESLDADNELIEGVHVERFAGSTDTVLAQALNPGDTSFLVQSAKGWSNQSPDARTRAIAWYGYRDSKGTLYPEFSYTRNVARDNIDGLWDQGAIVGNRITLKKPWAGPAIPNGTAVRNAVDSDSLIPALLNNGPVAQAGNATIAGVWQQGQRRSNQFPPGTASIRLAGLMNQSGATGDEIVTVQLRYGLPAPGFSIGATVGNRRIVDLDVLANDAISSAAVIRSVTQGVRGSVSIVPGSGTERSKLRYTSPQYFIGSDFFSYTVFNPQTGTDSTEQVFLQSLGGNLDQDATLRETIRVNSLVPKSLQGEIYLTGLGVKNERFIPDVSDIVRYPLGSDSASNTYVTLHYLASQSGSLNLLPSGKFDFEPIKDFVGAVPFVVGYRNGSDQRLGIGSLAIYADHFARDQRRLENIGFAVRYSSSRLFYPSNVSVDSNNKPLLSWRVYALPYMGYDGTSLFDRFRLDEPWNSPNNLPLLSEMPNVFRSGNDSASVTSTRYLAIANGSYPSSVPLFLNNANSLGNSLTLNRVTDGLSNTMLVVQAAPEKAIPWTKPDDLTFDAANPISTLGNVGSYFNVVFADSKVRALPTDMGNAMFRSLATISDGDFLLDPATLTRAAKIRADFPGDPITYDDNYQSNVMLGLTLAMLNHESAFKRFAPPQPASTIKNLSWRVYLLPFLEQNTLFNQFRLDEPWDSPTNLAAADKMPDIFRSLGDSPTSKLTRFRVLGGPNMAYGSSTSLNEGPRINAFTDGLSHSMLIVEVGVDKAVPWTKPDVMPIADGNIWNGLGQFNKSFMLVGMADASRLRIPTSTPPDIVRGLATINLGDAGRTEFDTTNGTSKPTNPWQQGNDLRQLGLGILDFESAFKRLPHDFIGNLIAPGSVGLSWRVAILPYIEEGTLYTRFHLDESWDSPHNLSLLPLMPSVFKTATDGPSSTTTRVQRFQGRNTIDPKQRITFNSIADGLSNTILVALSTPEKAVPWTKPADMEFSDTSGWEALGKNVRHTPVALADGSVTTMDRSIGNVVLNALVRRNDGIIVYPSGDVNVDPPRTIVVREGDAIDAITVSGQLPAIIDFDDPSLAIGFVKSDGYNRGLGASLQVGAVAKDNRIIDGKRQTKLNVRVLSNPNDPNSLWKLLYSINVIVLDNDVAAVQTNTAVPLTVAEGNATEIWIHLGVQPTANVIVTATESDTTEVAIPNRTYVFIPSDWFIPQRVIIDGVVDSIRDGDVGSEIQFAVTASTDAAFAASSPLVVPVTTLDNRSATLTILDAVTFLAENTVTANRIQIGRLVINDDGIGTNTLSLAGRDVDLFLLENDILYLRAGTLLDFETKNRLEVLVIVDDPAIQGNPDATLTHSVTITDANEAPRVAIINVVSELSESAPLGTGLRVADIQIVDDALGTNILSLAGPDASRFEIANGELRLKSTVLLDYETKPSFRVFVHVDDQAIGVTPDHQVTYDLKILDANDPPSLSVTNAVSSVAESFDARTGFLVANLTIIDDANGTNDRSLTGPDAAAFEWIGAELRLKPNTPLDFESKKVFVVRVGIDDPAVGTSPDSFADVTLSVTDVNEPPTAVTLSSFVPTIPESTNVGGGFLVARVEITDDALGNNSLFLAGADANEFVLIGREIRFKAGMQLDFESKNQFSFSVKVDDPGVGSTPDAVMTASIQITDVNEAPTAINFRDRLTAVRENSSISSLTVVGIVVEDDAPGSNTIRIAGPDARHFAVIGTNLEFRPQGLLDYETQSTYLVDVVVNDDSIAGSSPVSRRFSLGLTNVPEIVSVTDLFGNPFSDSTEGVRVVWDTLITAGSNAVRWWKSDIGAEVSATASTLHLTSRSITTLVFSGAFVQAGKLLAGDYQLLVDGNGIRSQDTDTAANDSQSNPVRVTPTILPTALSLAQLGPARVGEPFDVEVRVVGANTSSRYTYRLDLDNDGVFDRVFLNAPSPYVISNVKMDRSGPQTIRVVAESQFVVQAVGELIVPVTSWRAGNANQWLSGLDTDRDGTVSPLDVLTVINHLNSGVGGVVPYNLVLDVDRDASISPLDVLAIINHLNRGTPEDSGFRSLRMSNTGELDGFTGLLSVAGELTDATRGLYLSLDGGVQKDASAFVQTNGLFELTDLAIRSLFGDVRDGEHTMSAFVRDGSGRSIARDRRFFLRAQELEAPVITSAMQLSSGTFLQWTRPDKNVSYDIFVTPVGEPPRKLLSNIAKESTVLQLEPGEYDLSVDSVSTAGTRVRSKSVRIRVST